jgi:outer membrane receptor protein involved in Fe transport
MPRPFALLAVSLTALAVTAAEPLMLPEFAVGATRMPRSPGDRIGSSWGIAGDALSAGPTLDAALRRAPAFSLFRRSDSLSANPTAQGVSLRGVGPSGASRSLVLLDGVPLSDPFGGWVAWNSVPLLSLAGAEIRPGGGSAAWGNAALGGVIALVSREPAGEPGGDARLTLGDRGHRSGEAWLHSQSPTLSASVALRAVDLAGHQPLQPPDRGAVDRPLSVRAQASQVRLGTRLGGTVAHLGLRHFTEERGNGTVGQGNTSRMSGASLALGGRRNPVDWRSIAYVQSQSFSSRFTTVAAGRGSELPANDQFAVPASAWGGSLTIAGSAGRNRLTGGLDFRRVRGETREDYLFAAGSFTRRRYAGGGQSSLGAFTGLEAQVGEALGVLAQARVDRWAQTDGRRREVAIAEGTLQRDERFASRSGLLADGTIEARWKPGPGVTSYRASAYSAHRLPSLNELYRPFRVGPVSTEANPALRVERLRGGEIGAELEFEDWRFSASAFGNELRDAVGNVTLPADPTSATRQRLNLDRVQVVGAEAAVLGRLGRDVRLEAAVLLSSGQVVRALVQPALEGLRLAQAPRLTFSASASGRVADQTELFLRGRWSSRQFEDDENRLPLAAAGTLDLAVERRITRRTVLRIDLDNLLDADVPVGRTGGGPTAYASPRSIRGSVRIDW